METSIKQKRKENIQFYWLPVLLLLPAIWSICRYFHFTGLFGQDSHEYYYYMKLMSAYLTGGPLPSSIFWPVMFPSVGALVSLFFSDILSLQLLSTIAAGFTYIYFCKTLNLLYPSGTQRQRFAFMFLMCSPFFLRAALIALPDMLCEMFLVTCWYHLIRYNKEGRTFSLMLAVVLGILAIQTRYSSVLLILPLLPTLITAIRKRYSVLLMTLAIILFALIPTVILKDHDIFQFIHHPWLVQWTPLNFFRSGYQTPEGLLIYHLPNIIYILLLIIHPGFCFIAIPLVMMSLKLKTRFPRSWTYSLIIYLIFLAGIPFQSYRFLFLGFPLFLMMLYPAYQSVFKQSPNRHRRLFFLFLIIALQFTLAFQSIQPLYDYQQEEIQIALELKNYPPQKLYTFSIDPALHTYQVQHEIINLWTLPDSYLPSGSLFLYNPSRFNIELRETPPGKYYDTLRQQGRLSMLKTLPGGWQLYRLK